MPFARNANNLNNSTNPNNPTKSALLFYVIKGVSPLLFSVILCYYSAQTLLNARTLRSVNQLATVQQSPLPRT